MAVSVSIGKSAIMIVDDKYFENIINLTQALLEKNVFIIINLVHIYINEDIKKINVYQ